MAAAKLPAAVSYLPPTKRPPPPPPKAKTPPPPKPKTPPPKPPKPKTPPRVKSPPRHKSPPPPPPPPRARTPPRPKVKQPPVPPPRPRTPSPPRRRRTPTPPRKPSPVKRPISPIDPPRHAGKPAPRDRDDDYLRRQRRRRHSASDDYGDDDDDDDDVKRDDRAIRKLYPPVKLEKPKKPAVTPGPPTRGSRGTKSRGGYGLRPRPYGYEDPLLDVAGQERARLVTFYRNGDLFFRGIKASFRPGRDFVSMDTLFSYLTPRLDLPTGVRYIFTIEGQRVRRLDEFENGGSYVCSSRRKFEPMPYGPNNSKTWNPHLKFETPLQDTKLFRDPSPPVRKMNGLRGSFSPDGPYNGSVPGSREGRVIKVINNLNHKIQSRILLNLRTAQPWEEVLEDLGQALKMKRAKKLYTINGQEVKSFSQLRNEFKDVETFYLDTGESHRSRSNDPRKESSRSLEEQASNRDRDRDKRGKRPGSAPPVPGDRGYEEVLEPTVMYDNNHVLLESNLSLVRVLINGARRNFYPPGQYRLRGDISPPDKTLKLDWVYGYRGFDSKQNLVVLSSTELLYYVATVAILYDKLKHKQRHYLGHTEDITCLALTYNKEICATGQKEGKGKAGLAHVRIWDVHTLDTLAIIGMNEVDNGVAAVAFSKQNKGTYLMVVDESSDHVLSMWDWKHERMLGKTATYTREVNGGQFYPEDDNLIVTYGRSHLTAWRRRKDNIFNKHELLKAVGDNVLCIEFDEEGDLIAGDSAGAISVWTDDGEGGFRLCKEFQAHQRSVNSLLILPDGTLLSGGTDRYIKAWRNAKQYKLMATTMLPDTAGGIRTLCPQRQGAEDSNVYVGTTRNMILEGSLYRRFAIVVQGHYKNLTALAVDPDYASFVTAGEDRSICKWSMHKLQWRVQIESECTSLAFHPSDLVVVVGTRDGHFLALNADSGMHIATVTVSKVPVTCMTFNRDGTQFAVSSKEGNVHLYNVANSGFAYKKKCILRGHETLRNMDYSIDGRSMQSDSDDYDLIFWDIVNLEKERIPSSMRDVRWSQITCTVGYSIHGMWNNVNQRIQGLIAACHVSSSQRLLAAADDEGYIRLFRYPCISPRAQYHEIKPHTGPVSVVKFLYDDSFLVTSGGTDAALMQWMVISNR